jgi:hypothetical protein
MGETGFSTVARSPHLLALLCCFFVWLGPGVAPAAAVDVFPSFSPAVLKGSPPWTITYRVELDTGPAAERVDFWDLPSDVTLEGPGTIVDSRPGGVGGSRRDWSGRCLLRADSFWRDPRIDLPPNSTSVLVFHEVISRPLGLGAPDPDYHVSFFSEAPDGQFYDDRTVDVGGPRYAAARSFDLSLNGTFSFSNQAVGKRVALVGQVAPVVGKTTPLLAGQSIALRFTTAWPPVWHPLARVHVRAGGSFGWYRWRPARPGVYTVKPFYTSHDPRFVSESPTCGDTFEVLAATNARTYDRSDG